MATIKIYPPQQLPPEGVTDVQFEIWRHELEVYLEVDPKFQRFLPGGSYTTWEAAETYELRIAQVVLPDKAEDLSNIRRDLKQLVSIIAKYVHQDYYNPIVRHSTSVKWIYNKIRQDYNIQHQGVHFLNITDLVWDPTGQTTPVGFYNNYRSLLISNLGVKGHFIN